MQAVAEDHGTPVEVRAERLAHQLSLMLLMPAERVFGGRQQRGGGRKPDSLYEALKDVKQKQRKYRKAERKRKQAQQGDDQHVTHRSTAAVRQPGRSFARRARTGSSCG